MGIFPVAKGQLTLQYVIVSGQISKSPKLLWFSSFPVSMKNIQSKLKALEWSQHYTLFFRHSRAANSIVGCKMWPKFNVIQAFMVVLVTCKNDEDQFKHDGTRVVTIFLPL